MKFSRNITYFFVNSSNALQSLFKHNYSWINYLGYHIAAALAQLSVFSSGVYKKLSMILLSRFFEIILFVQDYMNLLLIFFDFSKIIMGNKPGILPDFSENGKKRSDSCIIKNQLPLLQGPSHRWISMRYCTAIVVSIKW